MSCPVVTRAPLTRHGTAHQNCSRWGRGEQAFCFLTECSRLQLLQEEGCGAGGSRFLQPRAISRVSWRLRADSWPYCLQPGNNPSRIISAAQQGVHGTVLSPLYALKERNVWMVELNTNVNDESVRWQQAGGDPRPLGICGCRGRWWS